MGKLLLVRKGMTLNMFVPTLVSEESCSVWSQETRRLWRYPSVSEMNHFLAIMQRRFAAKPVMEEWALLMFVGDTQDKILHEFLWVEEDSQNYWLAKLGSEWREATTEEKAANFAAVS